MAGWPDRLLLLVDSGIKRCKCRLPRTCDCCWVWRGNVLVVTWQGEEIDVRHVISGHQGLKANCSNRICVRLKHLYYPRHHLQKRTSDGTADKLRVHLGDIIDGL